jgi:uncharacterized repeat protein (TIGR03803 family)
MSLKGALLPWVLSVPLYSQTGAVRVLVEFQATPSAPYSIAEFAPGKFVGATNNFTPGGNVVYQIDSEGHYKTIATLTGTNDIPYIGLMADGKLLGIWFDGRNKQHYFHLPLDGGDFEMLQKPDGLSIVSQWPFGVFGPGGGFYAPFRSFIGRMDITGNVKPVYRFQAGDGVPNPFSSFAMAQDGTFYGENQLAAGSHFVYKVSPAGTLTKLAEIPNTGGPWAPLVATDDGTVYGAEAGGGTNKTGAIYKLTPAGQFSIAAVFPGAGLSQPATLLVAGDGNLYGSTNSTPSAIFRMDTKSGKLEQVASSNGLLFRCPCRMIQGSDGKLYGTSQTGGAAGGGTIFSIDAGIPPPEPRLIRVSPSAGKVGTKIELWGSCLLGTSSVTFGGVPVRVQDISVSSPNVVLAPVPVGAKSGTVEVRTKNGTAVSPIKFTVE